MAEVMQRVEKLRVAVDTATAAGAKREAAAQTREESVLPAEREALTRRRDELMEQVKEKNGKVKLLIDDLRELHRDIAVFQSLYRPVPPQQRAR